MLETAEEEGSVSEFLLAFENILEKVDVTEDPLIVKEESVTVHVGYHFLTIPAFIYRFKTSKYL